MSLPERLVIELASEYRPVVMTGDDSERAPVPVRLRGYQENLTQLYVGHHVTDFEWIETGTATKGSIGANPERLLVAWHDEQRCERCSRVDAAAHRDDLLDRDPGDELEVAAERATAFYRDYISQWDEHPDALNPRLDNMLRVQRLRANGIGMDGVHQWLEAATRYVHARMHQAWIEEDVLAKTRSQLNAMRAWGTFDIGNNDEERAPMFEADRSTWRVTEDGETERLTEVGEADRPTLHQWVRDPSGREFAAYTEALQVIHSRTKRALEDGKRLATEREIAFHGCEQAIAHRTEDLRDELPQLRTRLLAVTREVRGA